MLFPPSPLPFQPLRPPLCCLGSSSKTLQVSHLPSTSTPPFAHETEFSLLSACFPNHLQRFRRVCATPVSVT